MIRLLVIGKIKNKSLSILCKDYEKRINRYSKIEIIELKDNLKDEDERIIKLCDGYKTYVLDIDGKSVSSEKFSEILTDIKDICFVIGGPEGLGGVKDKYSKISLSKMTLTHEMARMLLLEQIYRGYTIKKGLPYHK